METIITIAAVAFLVWFLAKRLMPAKGVGQITISQLKDEMKQKKGKQFIDVRTPGEYQANHIKGFNNLPLQQLGKQADQLDKEKPVYVICQSGGRSSAASGMLKKKGFEKVINVQGGMNAWRG
ncbi:sulfurtransferase [Thalassobacillus devorans]|uniref:Sulfurtransferase n=1 Tax=Thalassobacillus devorans TaxID=279813 RepID=A0ABQ1NN04_9BACI|nr:rhodanese-like domain-containing protein [Thalassobacillus devorans]NIK27650.1 rhodanese-related sulfurtransferase [Thalassobacillus devorans]GGC79433.1 sulfurtransferase [Thalassobacillus devorans]